MAWLVAVEFDKPYETNVEGHDLEHPHKKSVAVGILEKEDEDAVYLSHVLSEDGVPEVSTKVVLSSNTKVTKLCIYPKTEAPVKPKPEKKKGK